MQTIDIPLSKSILNRCLILSALSKSPINYLRGQNDLEALPNDVVVMKRLLFENDHQDFDVEDAGTVFRFLTSYLSITPGEHLLYGTLKLNSRPIKPLVDALVELGADIVYTDKEGNAPLKITGKKLQGGEIILNGSLSSQFVSSLMLIAPTLPLGLKIHLQNPTSVPYILMTGKCLEYFGVEWSMNNDLIDIKYSPDLKPKENLNIESDWSSAAFWYALCAVTGKSFQLKNLSLQSIQGDKVCMEIFKKIGIETFEEEGGIRIENKKTIENNLTFNLKDTPDLAPALIVACALKEIEAKFYGLYTLELKESNRVKALQIELKKLNIDFSQKENYWELNPDLNLNLDHPLTLNTYNDHRLAMAFACIKALNNKIEIQNPECVRKSYPGFWAQIKS